MREAVAQMFAKYHCQRVEDTTRALREILQEHAPERPLGRSEEPRLR
ncbi:MAG: hypothetical protein IH614_02640 [Desulfuromonadales bacterium]|nr:hypothetical protein [Desulfuromonadales bacterium]